MSFFDVGQEVRLFDPEHRSAVSVGGRIRTGTNGEKIHNRSFRNGTTIDTRPKGRYGNEPMYEERATNIKYGRNVRKTTEPIGLIRTFIGKISVNCYQIIVLYTKIIIPERKSCPDDSGGRELVPRAARIYLS